MMMRGCHPGDDNKEIHVGACTQGKQVLCLPAGVSWEVKNGILQTSDGKGSNDGLHVQKRVMVPDL